MRQYMLEVAKPLMINKGYTAVGLAELVAAVGVPKGSFYYYFRSKEEFGQALLEAYFAEYLSAVDNLLMGQGTAAQRLFDYFRFWVDTQWAAVPDGKCLVVKLGSEVCDLSEDMRFVLEKGTRSVVERLARCIEEGQSDGAISSDVPADALAKSLYQMWLGASLQAKVDNARAPFDTALSMTKRMLS
ncbi:TetR/AcrR family transcriptional regulator [Paraburkholderia sediminicola]|uniref:TetR/AcrR family transcriptional regulator n=1 Tax=Paraburkholderia sediminicola TaxID=458836 RepID=UPI0038BA4272